MRGGLYNPGLPYITNLTNTSGSQKAVNIAATVAQGGTAEGRGLNVNVTISSQGTGGVYLFGVQNNGGDRFLIDSGGNLYVWSSIYATGGLLNGGGGNNSEIVPTNNGAVIDRNVNDANTCLTVNQKQGTGKILDLQFGGNSKFSFSKDGYPTFGSDTTGAGAAALGANCPAVTVGNPYVWARCITSDGSSGYIPIWK